MRRREWLSTLAALSAPGLAGCGSRGRTTSTTTAEDDGPRGAGEENSTATTTAGQDAIDVAAAGADTEGREPIDSTLSLHARDGARLVFPPGEYLVEDFTLVGISDLELLAPQGATLVPPDDIGNTTWMRIGQLENFRFQGFRIDNRGEGVAPQFHLGVVGGDNVVRDVEVVGLRDGVSLGFMPKVEGETTTLTFDRLRMADGNLDGAAVYAFPRRGFVQPDRRPGQLRFLDCHVENFSQGLYLSDFGGPIEVYRGRYANCGIAQIRIGGGHERARVQGALVVVDGPDAPSQKPNMRGIWCEEGENNRIENTEIRFTDLGGGYSDGAIAVGGQHGKVVLSDVRIRTDEPVTGLLVSRPADEYDPETMQSMERLPDSWQVTCRNVTVEGDAANSAAIDVAYRDDVRLVGTTVDQPGNERDGLRIVGTTGVDVEGGTWSTGGYPVLAGVPQGQLGGVSGMTSCIVRLSDIDSLDSQTTRSPGTSLDAPAFDSPNGDVDYCVQLGLFDTSLNGQVVFVGLTGLTDEGPVGHLFGDDGSRPFDS